jgi:uncharacterized protein YwlG (UPF0340 family)
MLVHTTSHTTAVATAVQAAERIAKAAEAEKKALEVYTYPTVLVILTYHQAAVLMKCI